MKFQSQIAMIALATLFTMALALSVALICITQIKDEPSATDSSTLPVFDRISDTEPLPPLDEPLLPNTSSGLRFSSNGDGTCALSGIGLCTDACVVIPNFSPSGERVTAIAPMAFYGNEAVTAVQIPAAVLEIGALAFADCPNLVYLSVSDENPYWCDLDGVLYSADLSTLVLYPPKRSGSEFAISSVTVRIADMAFYKCSFLEKIRYEGSPEQWERIRIGSKNYSLTATAKEFGNEN